MSIELVVIGQAGRGASQLYYGNFGKKNPRKIKDIQT